MIHQVHGELSFHLATPEVSLDVTCRAGHLAPVVFHLPGGDVSPYSLSPWRPEEYPDIPPLLSVLRGDFFCLPFGGQENGPPHGDPANAEWHEISRSDDSLCLVMDAADTGARLRKTVSVHPGQHAVYQENVVSNLEGDFSYGTHPVLDFTGIAEGQARVTVSPYRWASVYPELFSNPADGETQCLQPGAAFTDLREVPLMAGGTTDLTCYPAREGNDDLVMMAHYPASAEQPFAWSAAVMDGYVWFSLKNPVDFPCTLLWISNGGRSAPPWRSHHLGRMGIEDVCSHFAEGVAHSRLDILQKQGVATTRNFRKDQSVTLRTIQAAANVPAGFGAVTGIVPHGHGEVAVTGESGDTVIVPLDWDFVT
ncbi:MAG: hypothetical protein EOP85_04380 [Verrucomicrobiaceae bacterium]|nr:MAG: hypothetical protein EOP85_04380 [Verrucomicrobiaceae bacterium]